MRQVYQRVPTPGHEIYRDLGKSRPDGTWMQGGGGEGYFSELGRIYYRLTIASDFGMPKITRSCSDPRRLGILIEHWEGVKNSQSQSDCYRPIAVLRVRQQSANSSI